MARVVGGGGPVARRCRRAAGAMGGVRAAAGGVGSGREPARRDRGGRCRPAGRAGAQRAGAGDAGAGGAGVRHRCGRDAGRRGLAVRRGSRCLRAAARGRAAAADDAGRADRRGAGAAGGGDAAQSGRSRAPGDMVCPARRVQQRRASPNGLGPLRRGASRRWPGSGRRGRWSRRRRGRSTACRSAGSAAPRPDRMCGRYRAKGGDCFVRARRGRPGGAMAAQAPVQVASR